MLVVGSELLVSHMWSWVTAMDKEGGGTGLSVCLSGPCPLRGLYTCPYRARGGSLRPPGMRSIVGQAHFTQQSGLVSGLVAAELRDVGWLGRED